ncbi:MAG: gliding motility-associated C-terminal domain-containing protein [Saprospiraceae bacterium]|nr:gliding motility-associated C-terminal domain-containing protein [Lewinella sp.]
MRTTLIPTIAFLIFTQCNSFSRDISGYRLSTTFEAPAREQASVTGGSHQFSGIDDQPYASSSLAGVDSLPGSDCDLYGKGAAFLLGRWEGMFSQHSCDINYPYPMFVEFESFDGEHFTGKLYWPALSDAVTTMDGYILEDTVFIFERTQLNGDNIVVNGTYKSQIIDCCTLTGFWHVDELQPGCSDPQTLIDGGRYTIEKMECIPKCASDISLLLQAICAGTDFEGYTTSGTYLDTFLTMGGCDSIRQLELLVLPQIITPQVVDLCAGDSTFFAGQWRSKPGIYCDTLSANSGCDSLVKLEVKISELLWSCEVQPPTCLGKDDGLIELFVFNPSDHILYQLEGFPQQETPLFSNLKSSSYDLSIVSDNGCKVDTVLVVPEAELGLGFSVSPTDTMVQRGDTVHLKVLTSIKQPYIKWLPNVFLNCNNCPEVIIQPIRDMTYTVQIGTSRLCMAEKRVHIKVEEDSPYYVPNAFSPNGDGINDFFRIYPSDTVEAMHNFMIYNRWGEQVFFAAELLAGDSGWDGTFNGREMDSGVFLFSVEITLSNDQVEQVTGALSLLRGQ